MILSLPVGVIEEVCVSVEDLGHVLRSLIDDVGAAIERTRLPLATTAKDKTTTRSPQLQGCRMLGSREVWGQHVLPGPEGWGYAARCSEL